MTETLRNLRELALDRAKHEYAELSDNWKQIDSKAHQTVTIAGFFLAAVFALSATPTLDGADAHVKAGVVALLALLTTTVICAIMCMRVREASMPTPAVSTRNDVDLLVGNTPDLERDYSAELDQLRRRYLGDWIKANDEIESCNSSKVAWLQRSQSALMASAVISVLVTSARVFV